MTSPTVDSARDETTGKRRVLYFVVAYPTFSETYMHEEMRALADDHEIHVVTYRETPIPRREAFPYTVVPYSGPCLQYDNHLKLDPKWRLPWQRTFVKRIETIIDEFRPDVFHAHYLGFATLLRVLSKRTGIPWTVRTHSVDVLSEPDAKLRRLCKAANDDSCERVLVFPGQRQRLASQGLREDKLVDCWPVLPFDRFHQPDPHPPTGKVMCAGPAIPKKAHHEFIQLADRMRGSGLTFDLYADGPNAHALHEQNEALGRPVTITYRDPDDMHEVYPEYDWMVYPADREIHKVGLPVALCEAMAAGVGVCWQELPDRRAEQLEFLGGAGHLFRSIDEVPELITTPYPQDKRRAGIEAARRFDIAEHKHLLTSAWDRALLAR